MLVMIKGAGDIASGIALRLWRAGISVVMTDLPKPSSIRRTVCFSEAVYHGETKVEEVRARLAADAAEALRLLEENILPVIVDPKAESAKELHPDVIVDAILAKENLGTAITDAPGVIGVGPGFTAGTDCHAVVETMRGHTLGRVIWSGSAIPNTGVPGNIGGYTIERVMHSPCAGESTPCGRSATRSRRGRPSPPSAASRCTQRSPVRSAASCRRALRCPARTSKARTSIPAASFSTALPRPIRRSPSAAACSKRC